jgi:Cytochrome P450
MDNINYKISVYTFSTSYLQVYNEIQAILGNDPDKVPTYEQLQKLDLLNRVIKETMRLYPAVPIVARSSPEELHLCGYTIPAGKE